MRETSLEAYDDVKENIGKRQMEVLDIIRILGCPTNLEISKYSGMPINHVTPRNKELREKGYVTECEKRPCSVSGKSAMSWRLVD